MGLQMAAMNAGGVVFMIGLVMYVLSFFVKGGERYAAATETA